jgi:6-phosphogluconolactonase
MSGLFRYDDPVAAAEACGERILSLLEPVIASGEPATLAISGGSSPRPMFQYFARTPFAWDRVHLFWVDERCVPPDDPQSNFKLANDVWLAPSDFPRTNIHRVRAELAPADAASAYAEEIADWFGPDDAVIPHFDVIHRGMGPDGHTASLFPGEPLVGDQTRLTAAVWVEKMHQHRVTLLPGVLEAAHNTVVLVTGDDKAQVLKTVLHGPYDPMKYPAQIAANKAAWFADKAAAALLPIE